MAIDLTTIGRHKTIAGLAKAVFELKGGPELQARAEEVLLRANPALATEGGLRPGAPIIVPPIGLPGAGRESKLPAESIALVRRAAAALAEQAGAPLDAALKEATERAKSLSAKPTIEAIVAARPDLKEQLPAIAAAAQEEAKSAAEAAANLRDAIGRIEGSIPGNGTRRKAPSS